MYSAQLGRLSSVTYSTNSQTYNLTYDSLGRAKTATFADGRVLTYTYNDEGRLHLTGRADFFILILYILERGSL